MTALHPKWIVFIFGMVLLVHSPARAQEAGEYHHLELTYQARYRPGLAVLRFDGALGLAVQAEEVRHIVARDLDFSDRFDMASAVVGAIDYDRLDDAGVVWAIDGTVDRDGSVQIRIHDVVYQRVKEEITFPLPGRESETWRMAVHAVADQIVELLTGEPGIAATRIIFSLKDGAASDLYMIDADGEGLRRLTTDNSLALSPAWGPEADRFAYVSYRSDVPVVYERLLGSTADRIVLAEDGLNATPAYGATNEQLALAASGPSGRSAIRHYQGSRTSPITTDTYADAISPSFSPDGRYLAYVTNRLGPPHIYVHDIAAGSSRLLTSFALGGASTYLQAPDWSPRGNRIAFHLRTGGQMQIATTDVEGLSVQILTRVGRNEDPSWAPDGRHLVHTSDSRGGGLFILDTETGRSRLLVAGNARLADWSSTVSRFNVR